MVLWANEYSNCHVKETSAGEEPGELLTPALEITVEE